MADKQAVIDPKGAPGLPIHRRARALVLEHRKLAAEIQTTLDTLGIQKKQLWEQSKALQQVLETLPASGEGWLELYDGERALDDGLRMLDLRFVVRDEQRLEAVEGYIERSAELFLEPQEPAA